MKNKQQQREQQNQPRVTVGRRQVTPVLQSTEAKMRAQVDDRAKSDARVRELEREKAKGRYEWSFERRALECQEVLMWRIQTKDVTPEESARLAHVLSNGLARHKAQGKSAKSFDIHGAINEDAVRHGRAVAVPKTSGLDARLPPPPQQGHQRPGQAALPGDQAAHEATFRAAQQHGQSEAERERLAREDYRERLRAHGRTSRSKGIDRISPS